MKNKTDEQLSNIKKNIDEAFDKAQKNKIKIICLLENAEDILNERNKKIKGEERFKHNNKIKCECNDDVLLEKKPLCFRPWKQIATTVEGKLRPECMCLENVGDIHDCKNNIVSEEHKKFTCW